jgi:hypothetical protein
MGAHDIDRQPYLPQLAVMVRLTFRRELNLVFGSAQPGILPRG